jgi:Contractile injection system tube protein
MNLIKAQLIAVDGGTPDNIEFMFNPTQLVFEGAIDTADNPGARSKKTGHPKVSFSGIQPYKLTLNNLIFDTYESGQDVIDTYIEKFRKAIAFVDGKQRPPLYRFSWGGRNQPYFNYCFIERLTYKLTLFLPDGTPVRAVIDGLTLKETDPEEDITPPPQTEPDSNSSIPPKSLGRQF